MRARARGAALLSIAALVAAACGADGQWSGGIHARMGHSPEGLRVLEVPEGPARAAGLLPEDRIVAIDGVPVVGRDAEEVTGMLRGEVGTRVAIEVLRGAERLSLEVERAPYRPRPEPAAGAP